MKLLSEPFDFMKPKMENTNLRYSFSATKKFYYGAIIYWTYQHKTIKNFQILMFGLVLLQIFSYYVQINSD